jgi:hypothetical protein
MYDEQYGTDWDTLGLEEAIERAYALGVLAGVGEGRPKEHDRVRAAVGGPGSELVQLAYDEGQTAAAGTPEPDQKATWERLVEESGTAQPEEPDAGDTEATEEPASAPPSSLSAMKARETDPDFFHLPDFLGQD